MSYGNPELNQERIKCEECGIWFKKITSAHLEKRHSLNIPKYKEKYGFNKNQPLEAFYVRDMRIQKEREHNSRQNLESKKYKFRKNHNTRRANRQQFINRLQKYADIQSKSVFVLTPEEVITISDLNLKLKYPYEKIARLFRINVKTVKRILNKLKDGSLDIEKQRMR